MAPEAVVLSCPSWVSKGGRRLMMSGAARRWEGPRLRGKQMKERKRGGGIQQKRERNSQAARG